MEVKVADNAGFCFGVARAVEMASGAQKPIETLGPIIHNKQVIERLLKEDIYPVDTLDEVRTNSILIRSHGVTPEILETARNKGLIVIDATCPYVIKAQHLAKKMAEEDYQVIIVGDPEHPEVKGLVGWAGEKAIVVQNKETAATLPPFERRAVLSQTTLSPAMVTEVAEVLRSTTSELVVHDTVCQATRQRQEAAERLARDVDVMVVVGGKESANTRNLVKVCRATGTPTYHIETAGELCGHWFENVQTVGVTGGASTPAWIIEEVVVMLSENVKDMEMEEKEDTVKDPENGTDNLQQEVATDSKDKYFEETLKENEGQITEEENIPASGQVELPGREGENEIQMDAGVPELHRGAVVTGVVVQINVNEVMVDIGGKSEGIIPVNELTHRNISDPHEVIKVGDKISAIVIRTEDEEGHPVLSKRRADRRIAWENLEKVYETGEEIQGEVIEVVKGGLLVDVGVRGFVPASLIERGYVEDLNIYMGQVLRLRVIEMDRSKNKVVLSQKVILEEDFERRRHETWNSIEAGQVRKGTVRRLTNFGAFVDLGGVDGLLHVSEISWGRVEHPRDALSEGQEIEVKVLGVDREAGKVSLGRKQLLPNPWETVSERYKPGAVVTGKVLRIAPFGAFVEIEPGIEGLVHISQLDEKHVEKPEEVVHIGDNVKVKILGIDQEVQRMSLSIRQANRHKQPKQVKQQEIKMEKQDDNVKLGDLFGELFEEEKE